MSTAFQHQAMLDRGLFSRLPARRIIEAEKRESNSSSSFWPTDRPLRYADLFCGIGGFHTAASSLRMKCVFASDIDEECRKAYKANYGLEPKGDIRGIDANDIPDIDVLLAGFPCQPFSIIGSREGFARRAGNIIFRDCQNH